MQITEDQRQEIASLFDQWNAALKTCDAKQVAALYAQDAMLLPTISKEVRQTPGAIQDYFEHFLQLKPRGTILQQKIRRFDGVATNSGIYKFTITQDGEERVVMARFTFVYRLDKEGWKIIDHHSSMLPDV